MTYELKIMRIRICSKLHLIASIRDKSPASPRELSERSNRSRLGHSSVNDLMISGGKSGEKLVFQ